MASIKKLFRHQPIQEQTDIREFADAVLADNVAMHAAFVAFTAKLDADITAGGASETNYAATLDPAALTLTE